MSLECWCGISLCIIVVLIFICENDISTMFIRLIFFYDILFLFYFISINLFIYICLTVHNAYFLSCLVDLPVWPLVPGIVGLQRISGPIPGFTIQMKVGTCGSSNGPTHDPTPQDRLSSLSIITLIFVNLTLKRQEFRIWKKNIYTGNGGSSVYGTTPKKTKQRKIM